MKLHPTQLDRRDFARDEFRDAVERYNKEARTYNEVVSAAHDKLTDAYFDGLEPALRRLASLAYDVSLYCTTDEWAVFATSVVNEDGHVLRAPFPVEPVAADLVSDSIATEFESLPTEFLE